MIFRILFLFFIGYILYSLVRLFLFIKDNSSFTNESGKDRLKENRGNKNRFSKKNDKIIELDKDQYKVE